MYQQGYQDGPNGSGQERGWYADPPYQDAPAPRRRSRSRGQNDYDAGMQAPSQMQGPYGYASNGVNPRADQPGGYQTGYPQGGYEEPAGPYDPFGFEEPAMGGYPEPGYREPNSYSAQNGYAEPNNYQNQNNRRNSYPQGGYGESANQYGYEEPAMGGYPEPNNYREPNSYPEPGNYRSQRSRRRGSYPQPSYDEPFGYDEPAAQGPYGYEEPAVPQQHAYGYDEPAPHGQTPYREPGYRRQNRQSRNSYAQNGYDEPAPVQPQQPSFDPYGPGQFAQNQYDEPAPVQQPMREPQREPQAQRGQQPQQPSYDPYGQGQYAQNQYDEPAPVQQPMREPQREPQAQRGQQSQQPSFDPYGQGQFAQNQYDEPAPVQQPQREPQAQRGQQPQQPSYDPYGPGQFAQNQYDEPAPVQQPMQQPMQQLQREPQAQRGPAAYNEPSPMPQGQNGYQQQPYRGQNPVQQQPNQPQNSYADNPAPQGGAPAGYNNQQQPDQPNYGTGYRPQNYPQGGPGQPAGGAGAPPSLRNLIIALVTLLVVIGGIVLIATANQDTTNNGNNNPPAVTQQGQPIITLNKNQASAYATKFLPNVYVDGICLADMTFQEGSDAVWAQAKEKQTGWYVRLKNENGNYKDITADMLGISFDPTSALQQAWAIGHTPDQNGQISDKALMQAVNAALATEYHFTSAQQSANTSPIDTILDTLQTNAYRAPQDAVILSFNPDDFVNPFTFQQEVWGQWLDISAVKQEILNMVSTLESGEVMLTITPIAPNVTVADLQKTVTLRCRAVTPISSNSTEDRTNNIRVALSKINGKSLAHGDKFSFNKFVGRRTMENGFFQAIEYAYGEEVMGVGGGVCQASTTVYLAAVQSGMTITNREAHSNPVNYTSLGMDATVSDTRGREVDFTFKNESGGRIFIAAHVVESGSNRRSLLCEVRIYGPSLEDVHYKLESETIEVLPKPEEPKLKEDKTGEHAFFVDETKMASKGREGYVVDTYLCTYQGDTLISREKISTDTYPARQDVMWVGINPR